MEKGLKEYVQSDMVFRADVPRLLKETIECSRNGVYPLCWKLVGEILGYLAQRCIDINDPQLNILMISLGLYELPPLERSKYIEKERERMQDVKQK